jgi:uncharacterized protein (DUF2062 family)
MRRSRFRQYLPDPETVLSKRWAAPFRPWLGHPNLWHLNRRSVPCAMGIGLFTGLIPGPFQMLGALILAIPFRANVPLAMFVTLYTNPLTIVPIYFVAYGYGRLILGTGDVDPQKKAFEWPSSIDGFLHWAQSLGKPLGIGLLALALTLGLVGYCATRLAWRAYVVSAWRRRARRAGEARPR